MGEKCFLGGFLECDSGVISEMRCLDLLGFLTLVSQRAARRSKALSTWCSTMDARW